MLGVDPEWFVCVSYGIQHSIIHKTLFSTMMSWLVIKMARDDGCYVVSSGSIIQLPINPLCTAPIVNLQASLMAMAMQQYHKAMGIHAWFVHVQKQEAHHSNYIKHGDKGNVVHTNISVENNVDIRPKLCHVDGLEALC